MKRDLAGANVKRDLAAEAFKRALDAVRDASKPAYLAGWARWSALEKRSPLEWNVTSVAKLYEKLSIDYKPATLRLTFTVAKRVWKEAQVLGAIPDEAPYPFRHLRIRGGGVRGNVPEWNVMQRDELEKLDRVLAPHPRDRAIVRALGLQGWRASELCSMKWEDIRKDKDGDDVVTFVGKGNKVAEMMVQPLVMEAAGQWAGKRRAGPFIAWTRRGTVLTRQSLYLVVARWSLKVLGHKVTPHGLRATFISDAIERKGIEAARKLARQSDIKTTQRYSRFAAKKDDVLKF